MFKSKFHKLSATLLVATALFALHGPAYAGDTTFNKFAGRWVGEGVLKLSTGDQERMRCRATYFVRDNGRKLSQNLRCASGSFKIESKGSLFNKGGRISGSWRERIHEINANISGRASKNLLNLVITGNNLAARLAVSIRGIKQRVTMSARQTSGGSGTAKLVINLTRG